MKVCPKCNKEKSLDEFYKRANGKPSSWCKTCSREREKTRMADPDKRAAVRARQREWAKRNPNKVRDKKNARRVRDKLLVVEAYGGKCECCGETEKVFLTVDHRNGRTPTDPDKNNLYRYIIRNDFPRDIYQLLCFNCNCGRQINGGTCPHQGPTSLEA